MSLAVRACGCQQCGRMTITLCVLLWATDGGHDELVAYEDDVLELLPDHGARGGAAGPHRG